MDLFGNQSVSCSIFLVFSVLLIFHGAFGAKFTFVNKCDFTVWPGILSGAGSLKFETTGFELRKGSSKSFQAPAGWSGRFWGRTGCSFDGAGRGACTTGDCGSGEIECNGAGAAPPATLAEFTLGSGASSPDFYDVSLVDGYNLPMIVEGTGGTGACGSTGCVTDLNRQCPAELKAENGGACRSACEKFGTPEYCCSGAYGSPATCKPTKYSEIFKSACPRSYSYAYDDATSTFTCSGADYTVTFCPSSPSLKSSTDSSPRTATGTGTTTAGAVEQTTSLPENSWLADLAIGDSTRTHPNDLSFLLFVLIFGSSFFFSFLDFFSS
ncbi:thaumatin-like protein 1 isoform X1 [Benincasa hispida]|uniref:thaumatin-like protein 1 isoform X1 n=1 Tax=Benincasa hispida TaxID=102211 RepID=UPI001901B0AC|nr:thaumatin-like protein 1 isoform X1 [Benincasa hispida]